MTDFYFFDIGSRGMTAAEWHVHAENVHVVGFEPDAEECEKLNFQTDATPFKSEHHYPFVLSMADGNREFFVTRDPACSSLYRPNKRWFAHNSGDPDRADVIEMMNVYTRSLKSFCDTEAVWPDFIKIDAQGAEAEILVGYNLASVYGVQLELLTVPFYAGMSANYILAQEILNIHGFRPWQIKPTFWEIGNYKRLVWFDMLFLNENKLDDPDMNIIFDVYQLWLR